MVSCEVFLRKCRLRLANGQANHVRMTGKVAGAGAVSGFLNGHGRERRESFGQRLHNRRTCWSDQFDLNARGIDGSALQQFDRSGNRYRKNPVRAVHRTPAHVQRRTDDLIDSQGFCPNRCADDVDHCVHCPDFVEVHFFDSSVMDLGFRRAERLENGDGRAFCAVADVCFADDLANLLQAAAVFVLMLVGRGRRSPRDFVSRLTVVVFAEFNVLGGMGMAVIVGIFMLLRAALLLQENLARQFFFPVHENIDLGRGDAASADP